MSAPSRAVPATLPSEFTEWAVVSMIEAGFMRPQLGAVVSFLERIDTTRLAHAVRLAMDAEPVLGCRFVCDVKRPFWERLQTLDAADPLPVVGTETPEHTARAFIAEAFDPSAGPQLAARLMRGPDADVLAVKMSHVAVDGGALKECLYLLSDLYERLGYDADIVVRPNVDGARSLLPIASAASWSERLHGLRQDDILPKTEWGIPGLDGGRGAQTYLVRRVEADAFRAVRARGQRFDATVNDLLTTAYLRTLYAALDPAPTAATPLQLSCDLRRWLPDGTRTALSNISATWTVRLSREEGEDFGGTLVRVVAETTAWKAGEPGIRTAVGLWLAGKVVMPAGIDALRKRVAPAKDDVSENGYPVLTNIGVIDDLELCFGTDAEVADAYLLGPIAFPTGFVLTASTFRDALVLSAGIDTLAIDRAFAESLLEGTVAQLAAFADGEPAPSGD